jgi:hypothetical protein
MTMNVTRKTRVFGIVVLTALVLQKSLAGESSREADGAPTAGNPAYAPSQWDPSWPVRDSCAHWRRRHGRNLSLVSTALTAVGRGAWSPARMRTLAR